MIIDFLKILQKNKVAIYFYKNIEFYIFKCTIIM